MGKNHFYYRNFFLDFDGYGHLSSLEQNFNPSKADVKRKTALGMSMSMMMMMMMMTMMMLMMFSSPPPPPFSLSL